MLETKLAKYAGRLHQFTLNLALNCLNKRDKAALAKLDLDLAIADRIRTASADMQTKATHIEDNAHIAYGDKAALIQREYSNTRMALERLL